MEFKLLDESQLSMVSKDLQKVTSSKFARQPIYEIYKHKSSLFTCIVITIEEFIGKPFRTVGLDRIRKYKGFLDKPKYYSGAGVGVLCITATKENKDFKPGYFYFDNRFEIGPGTFIIWEF